MKTAKCTDCGSEDVMWAHTQRQTGEWKPMMLDSVPGGKMQSYSVSVIDGKARGEFVMNNKQAKGVNYFAAHYKTCPAQNGGGSSGPVASKAPVASGSVAGKIVVTIGNTEYEGTLTERVPF